MLQAIKDSARARRTGEIFGLAVAVVFVGLAGCSRDPGNPEDVLRDWVDRAELSAEEKNRGELLDMISESYTDGRGNSREDIGNMLRLYFFRQQSVELLTRIDEIVLMGDTAAMIELTVGMAATNENAFGFDADAYRFEFELETEGDDWKLIGSRWGALGGNMR